ncbi:MAG: ATP-grasp domain-containing protein [Elusimicrobiota bacterium]
MKLIEAKGKSVLARCGIAVPAGEVAATPEAAEAAARSIGRPVVVKAQVLAPGRKQKGGILFADSPEEAKKAAAKLLGAAIGEETCREVLVEEKLEIVRETYLAAMVDTSAADVMLIFSPKGGESIEDLFRDSPDQVATFHHNPLRPFYPFYGRKLASAARAERKDIPRLGQAAHSLYHGLRRFDARLMEINPLAVVKTPGREGIKPGEKLVAVDAIVNLDEDAVLRNLELQKMGISMEEERPRPPTENELKAIEIDKKDYRGSVHYQDLDPDGDIGTVTVGSGLSLTMLDLLRNAGLRPKGFCDCSGSPPAHKVHECVKLVLSLPGVKGFLFMSGVVTQDLVVTAEGIVSAFKEMKPEIPFVVRLAGNRDREALETLKAGGIEHAFPRKAYVEDCVAKLQELMKARAEAVR